MENDARNVMEQYRNTIEKLLAELGEVPAHSRGDCIVRVASLVESCLKAEIKFAALGVLQKLDMESDNFDADIAERLLDVVEDIIDSDEYADEPEFGAGEDYGDDLDGDDEDDDEDDDGGHGPLPIIDLDTSRKK